MALQHFGGVLPNQHISKGALHMSLLAYLPPPEPNFGESSPSPPPDAAVQRLALYAFEAVEGVRSISGLGRLISPAAIGELQVQRRARTEQRSLYGDTRRVVPTPGPAHVSRPQPLVVEAVVVLRAAARSVAVAIKLEFTFNRWQATQVTVL